MAYGLLFQVTGISSEKRQVTRRFLLFRCFMRNDERKGKILPMGITSKQTKTNRLRGLKRRDFLFLGAVEILGLTVPFSRRLFAQPKDNLSNAIVELITLKPLEKPLLTFHGFQDDQDYEIKKRIVQDVSINSDLLAIIQKDIGKDSDVQIRFETLESELLFVPESRKKYGDVYREYCRNVIDLLFSKINMDVPINQIVTLNDAYPEVPEHDITAYIVHQLGKKYKAICSFTNMQNKVSRSFKLEGAYFTDQLGSVMLEITCPEKDVFQLKRKPYTIWQNRTHNLVNILAIPVEETLHYIMGQYTDKKLADMLKSRPVKYTAELSRLSAEWMSVEEAVVGGLVHDLLPEFVKHFKISLSEGDMQLSFLEKSHLPQYKLRQAGISFVKKTGYRNAIDMYKDDPAEFAKMIHA